VEDLSGRAAVVTGAASGIGFALAERAASEGMRVVMADVEETSLKQAAAEVADATGAEVVAVVADVSDLSRCSKSEC
jgi:NAD(P)-dependent dehydrogenase (short-subunit alcohol dehydrogenase family)